MKFDFDAIQNPFIRAHLAANDRTEPPQLFHIWSAISLISACMGRHLVLETGIGTVYGNQFVLLVGPPGTRKGTAMKLAKRVLKVAKTEVKFAPDDTSGQRQGLISAMKGDSKDGLDDFPDASQIEADDFDLGDMLNNTPICADPVNKHVMFAFAPEFGSFLGQNSLDFTRFLIKMWDGDDYFYKLRKSSDILESPLLSLLGATTSQEIVTLLPPEAIGQGFMSRCVLVYQPFHRQRIRIDKARIDHSYDDYIAGVYNNVWYNMRGAMTLAESAGNALEIACGRDHKLSDNRFLFYLERRETHLLKLSMALAAADGSMEITESHVLEAEAILSYTEILMPDALGEYGLSPLALAKQKLLEFLRHAKEPVSRNILWAVMSKDMRLIDFEQTLAQLQTASKITQVSTNQGISYVYRDTMSKYLESMDEDALAALLLTSKEDVLTDG